ncbi:extracellular calcium-sensing receptor-like [Hyla sarda]|uniref:extracellular calcium-sensing receptor-like n=1 Tax=Hyla sarda TaxID=327740 RepID=UPI0024C212B5|nr:extracellular calcium-sensing receptor-like [Hyla sarda]
MDTVRAIGRGEAIRDTSYPLSTSQSHFHPEHHLSPRKPMWDISEEASLWTLLDNPDPKVEMVHRVLWALVLFYLVPVTGGGGCDLISASKLEGMSQPGDIMLGALIPLHLDRIYQKVSFDKRPSKTMCTMFHLESYQQIQALLFAVEEINNNPSILPNITLGYHVYDSCNVLQYDLEGALQVLTGSGRVTPNYRCLLDVPLGGVIGAAVSSNSLLLAHILGLFRYPQVSHFSTSRLLSDRNKFPSFFRTVPSDAFQSQGLANLVLHFGWTWVGLVAVDNDYGHQGIQLVIQDIVKAGACVAFTAYILGSKPDRNAPHIVKVMKESTVRVVIVFSTELDFIPVADEILRQNLRGKIFVASEGWSTSFLYSMEKFAPFFSGTIGLALYSGIIPGYEHFLHKVQPFDDSQTWKKIFWEVVFNCTFLDIGNRTKTVRQCTGTESLTSFQNSYIDVSNLRTTYNVYTAVYTFANALMDLQTCNKGNGPFINKSCADILDFKPWQLLYYMKKARVTLSNGKEFYFDENGDAPAIYDIVNWQLRPEGTIQPAKIGSYDSTTSNGIFTIKTGAILWDNGETQVPQSVCSKACPLGYWKATNSREPVCCFQCVPCPLGEVSNQTDALGCFKCPWDKWPDLQKTKCVQKTEDYLSYEEPLGTTLAVINILSSLGPYLILRILTLNRSSALVKASNYSVSCLLLGSLSLCFLCSLFFIGYPKPEKCLLRQAAFGMAFVLCVSCILAKTIIVLFAFMAIKPRSNMKKWTNTRVSYVIISTCFLFQFLLCISWLSLRPPFMENNIHTNPSLIIVECNEGSPIAFWSMLGYLFILASISFLVAFLVRRLPNSFNEAQYITFSMLAFLCVWVSFIPATLSAQGKYTVAMEIFAIMASSWAILICMFLPKCFIIVFRPDRNSKDYVMQGHRYPAVKAWRM